MLPAPSGPASRVVLAALGLEHAGAMERWARDPLIARNVGIRGPVSAASTRAWIDRSIADETILAFAITLDGAYVGNVILDLIDDLVGAARLSIYLGDPSARGHGNGRHALELALGEAFGARGLNKVWLIVHVGNIPAIAAYEHVGFVAEGVLREEFLLDGARVDALRMAVLRAEHKRS